MKWFGLVKLAIGLATCIAAGHLGLVATGHHGVWGPARPVHAAAPTPPPVAVHPASCPTPTAPPPPLDAPTAPDAVTITVSVPATTFVEFGTNGRAAAAITNTGCPPRATDDLWAAGALTRLSPSVLAGVKWYRTADDLDRYTTAP